MPPIIGHPFDAIIEIFNDLENYKMKLTLLFIYYPIKVTILSEIELMIP